MKKFSTLVIMMLFSLFFTSCKKYESTIAICDKKLFVEIYKNKFIDVAYDYLTDSSNFRIYIGKFDYEHGYYRYNCQNDSVEISETFEGEIINIRKYSLVDLRK